MVYGGIVMELKGRLRLIADKTPACNILCDIGTDHAYIPIFLVKNKRCRSAIACDVGKGPLMAAKSNVCSFNLEEHIDLRLGDGLDPLGADEADVIIIAGMGGNLMERILKEGVEKAKNAQALVLQAMNETDVLRKWLYDNGFGIYDEALAAEGQKIYNVICAAWTGEKRQLDKVYYHVGEKLSENRDPLLERYLNKKIKQLEGILKDMEGLKEAHAERRNGYMDLLEGFKRLKDEVCR